MPWASVAERRDRAPAFNREVRVNNSHSENRILSSVSPEIFPALKPHLSLRELKLGKILGEVGDRVREVFFPQSGIISLVVELSVGQMVETAMVGRDGVVNAS